MVVSDAKRLESLITIFLCCLKVDDDEESGERSLANVMPNIIAGTRNLFFFMITLNVTIIYHDIKNLITAEAPLVDGIFLVLQLVICIWTIFNLARWIHRNNRINRAGILPAIRVQAIFSILVFLLDISFIIYKVADKKDP